MAIAREIVEQQLEALGDFHKFFTRGELKYLPEILNEDEVICGVTSGFYEGKTWIVVVTEARIIFLDKGMFYGLRQIDMPVSQINSVSNEVGFFFGKIKIATASGSKEIEKIARKDVIRICSVISSIVSGKRSKPNSGGRESRDLPSQIEKLFELKEKGALTEEEYSATKDALLRRSALNDHTV